MRSTVTHSNATSPRIPSRGRRGPSSAWSGCRFPRSQCWFPTPGSPLRWRCGLIAGSLAGASSSSVKLRLTGRTMTPNLAAAGSVVVMQFSRELRSDVLAGEITLSVRLWQRPQVKEGGRYRVGLGEIKIDRIELVPFAAITEADVRRAGEPDRETLRDRAAHAGPIDEDTLVYRIEFHTVSPGD